jgi:hypothetical protein
MSELGLLGTGCDDFEGTVGLGVAVTGGVGSIMSPADPACSFESSFVLSTGSDCWSGSDSAAPETDGRGVLNPVTPIESAAVCSTSLVC